MKHKAQGTIEYLVIIAVVIVISLIVVALLINITGNNTADVTQNSANLKMSTGPIAINDSAIGIGEDANGALIIQNNTADTITNFKINLDGKDHNYYTTLSPGTTRNLLLNTIAVPCPEGQKTTNQPITITYTNQNGITKTINYGNVTLKCIETKNPNIKNPTQEGQPPTGNEQTVTNNSPTITLSNTTGNSTATNASYDFTYTPNDTDGTITQCFLTHNSNNLTADTSIEEETINTLTTTLTSGNNYWKITCTDNNGATTTTTEYNLNYSPPAVFATYQKGALSSGYSGAVGANPKRIAVDSSGNAYILGTYCGSGSPQFGAALILDNSYNGSGRPVIYNMQARSYIAKVSNSGDWQWASWVGDMGGLGNSFVSYPMDITVDSSGNPYIAGTFSGNFYNGPTGSNIAYYGSGGHALYLLKLDKTNGTVSQTITASPFGSGASFENGDIKLAPDQSGNIYITGLFCGSATFGSAGRIDGMNSVEGKLFIAKVTSSGDWEWAKTGSNSNSWRAYFPAISVDSSGQPYILSNIYGTAYFGSGVTYSNYWDSKALAVLRYSTSGSLNYEKIIQATDPASIQARGIAIDLSTNKPYIMGLYSGGNGQVYDFTGAGTLSTYYNTAFVTKLNPETNNFEWVKADNYSSGGINLVLARDAIKYDPITHGVYIGGLIMGQSGGLGTGQLGADGIVLHGGSGDDYKSRGFIMRGTSSGVFDWAKQPSSSGNSNAYIDASVSGITTGGIAVNTSGYPYMYGGLSGIITFPTTGSDSITVDSASNIGYSFFVWKTDYQ